MILHAFYSPILIFFQRSCWRYVHFFHAEKTEKLAAYTLSSPCPWSLTFGLENVSHTGGFNSTMPIPKIIFIITLIVLVILREVLARTSFNWVIEPAPGIDANWRRSRGGGGRSTKSMKRGTNIDDPLKFVLVMYICAMLLWYNAITAFHPCVTVPIVLNCRGL